MKDADLIARIVVVGQRKVALKAGYTRQALNGWIRGRHSVSVDAEESYMTALSELEGVKPPDTAFSLLREVIASLGRDEVSEDLRDRCTAYLGKRGIAQ